MFLYVNKPVERLTGSRDLKDFVITKENLIALFDKNDKIYSRKLPNADTLHAIFRLV